jgi:leucyl aminopeptidase
MRIEYSNTDRGLEAVVLFAFEDGKLPEAAKSWAANRAEWLPRRAVECPCVPGKACLLHGPERAEIPRVVLAGLGKRDKFDLFTLRESAAAALALCRERRMRHVGLPLAALEGLGENEADVPGEIAAAAMLGLYAFDAFKSEKSDKAGLPETLALITGGEPGAAIEAAVRAGEAGAAGVALARDLINTPPNVATPRRLAASARETALRHGFKADVLDEERIRELGMRALLSVARGSGEPPRLAVVDTAPGADERPLVFVGKGVTFDTGGISLKPSAGMEAMKGDMAGAAAVIGALEALGRLGVDRRVAAVIPLVENMPGRDATRPGDVIRTMSGKTVEIVNTDAEGRLILCDALTYAARLSPAAVVDIATLTGACVVALGKKVGGFFTEDEKLAEIIERSGPARGDRFWRLPLWDSYFEALKSEIADMKNVGDRMGGAVHAALFLKQFAPESAPWAHLDIAGPGYTDSGSALVPKGGAGFGVRTLLDVAKNS